LKVALDTNVLAYAEGVNDAEKRNIALDLIGDFPQEAIVVPVQALGELFNVLVRKAGRSRAGAGDALLAWRDTFPIIETTPE
jgi:predicted nucleic acid-binding protein